MGCDDLASNTGLAGLHSPPRGDRVTTERVGIVLRQFPVTRVLDTTEFDSGEVSGGIPRAPHVDVYELVRWKFWSCIRTRIASVGLILAVVNNAEWYTSITSPNCSPMFRPYK